MKTTDGWKQGEEVGQHSFWVFHRALAASLIAVALVAAPAAAADDIYVPSVMPSSSFGKTHIVEWDIPAQILEQAGGGITVDSRGHDNNRVWFLSRDFDGTPRLFRFEPSRSLMKGRAQWRSWNLNLATFTGGVKRLKPSYDRRYVFVRTQMAIQRVDTHTCQYDSYGAQKTCDLTIFVVGI